MATTPSSNAADTAPEPKAKPEAPNLVKLVFEAQCPLVIDGLGELEPGQEILVEPAQAMALEASPFFSRA